MGHLKLKKQLQAKEREIEMCLPFVLLLAENNRKNIQLFLIMFQAYLKKIS